MTTDVGKLARRNRNYYLSERKADNGKMPWFRYVKTMDVYAEPVLVSPKMARELLDGFDLRKPIPLTKVRRVAEELESKISHRLSVSFYGRLLDGRVVLNAILLNRKSAIVVVSFNVFDKLGVLKNG